MSKLTIENNGFYLFLDDEREVSDVYDIVDATSRKRHSIRRGKTSVREGVYTVARSSDAGKLLVQAHGMPLHMSLDHDLGGSDTTMEFLKWLAYEYFDPDMHDVPSYVIHSANPVGQKNIQAFMESWEKSLEA
jgi:hypothetical protein